MVAYWAFAARAKRAARFIGIGRPYREGKVGGRSGRWWRSGGRAGAGHIQNQVRLLPYRHHRHGTPDRSNRASTRL
ncbi:hypothetical protein GCM10027089_24790 [Nocardia thraciensis]